MTDSIIFEAYNSISNGVFVLDHDYRVIHWNECMVNWTGIEAKNIQKQHIFKFFPSFNTPRIQQSLSDLFEWGTPVIFSSMLHSDLFNTENNDTLDKYFEVSAISPDHEFIQSIYAVFTVENVTGLRRKIDHINALYQKSVKEIEERIKVVNSLQETERQLRNINSIKDRFISVLAHDMRNQLGGSVRFLEMMISEFSTFDVNTLHDYTTKIHGNIAQSYELLELLLEWGKNKITEQQVQITEINLYALVNKLSNMSNHQKEEKKIIIVNNIPDGLLLPSDSDLLSSILRNLLTNALKFSKIGGRVFVKYENTISYHRVIITDNGVGMKTDKLNKLFSTGIESSNGTTGETGSGLGLLICKDFIDKLKGKITVESMVNEGTSFMIDLPKKY